MRGHAYIVANRGAAGLNRNGRAPQAQIGSRGRRRRLTGEGGHLSCHVKSYFELWHLSCRHRTRLSLVAHISSQLSRVCSRRVLIRFFVNPFDFTHTWQSAREDLQ